MNPRNNNAHAPGTITSLATSEYTASTDGLVLRNMKKRYGILMLIGLTSWTLTGFVPMLESILANGLLLDNYAQLAFLSFVNFVAVVFCIATMRLLNRRIPGGRVLRRFGDSSNAWTPNVFLAAGVIGSFTPIVLAVSFNSEYPATGPKHLCYATIAVALGGASASILLLALGRLKCRLFGHSEAFFPCESHDHDGWVNQLALLRMPKRLVGRIGKWAGLEHADYQFALYLLLLATIHWGAARWFSGTQARLTSAPSMVVLLIWISSMMFAGAANLLDRFRLPMVPMFLIGVTLWQIPWGATRPLETVLDKSSSRFVAQVAKVRSVENKHLENFSENKESRTAVIARETRALGDVAWSALKNRMQKIPEDGHAMGKTAVVVTCPGGGIHAAAWAACVLESISTEYSDFADSICVISGVSGGSVGALFFVSQQYAQVVNEHAGNAQPAEERAYDESGAIRVGSALDLASRSALEPIAYGMITDDLFGAMLPPLSLRDRGQRLEDSLMLRLPEPQRELTLGDWGDLAVKGDLPIVVFNSTDASTGRRVLFDTIPTPRRPSSVGLTSRPIDYRELMLVSGDKAFDVKPATAVRTSATFPYVSPFTTPSKASRFGKAVALCDGGYADNEGIVTAISWVEFLLKRWAISLESNETRPFDRILILRIQPSATIDGNTPSPTSGLSPWMRWITGPAETIVKVRSASQSERGNLETDLAALFLRVPTEQTDLNASLDGLAKNVFGDSQDEYQIDMQFEQTAQRIHTATKEENRRVWKGQLEEFKKRLQDRPNDGLESDDPPSKAIFPGADSGLDEKELEVPVIVQTVAFHSADQVVPLNWKLSKEQKLWYLLSWDLCAAPNTSVRETLNRYFSPTTGDPPP